ncbi:MAG: sensor histidine kinase, partial [Alphaproteobacteria bacterium]
MISEPLNTTDQSNHLQKTHDDQLTLVLQFLSQLPYYVLLLNENHKIVVSNNRFLTDNELEDVSAIFDKGPGDIFQCENAELEGCGNSKNCSFCGIFKTISECHRTNAVVANPCRLMVNRNSFIKAYEFMARCSPVILGKSRYFLLTLTDLSAENRKLNLERIFYHDVLNMVNGLQGLLHIMKMEHIQIDTGAYLEMFSNTISRLGETIISHRDLLYAEKKELAVTLKQVTAKEVIDMVKENSLFYDNKDAKNLQIKMSKKDIKFHTDPVLLSRVLVNMVKKALEAPNTTPMVTLGCRCTDLNNHIDFYVHNNAYIGEGTAKTIFQPMCSTKGNNRGLGTYSIRLIGENYLNGKVWFESLPETG